MTIRGSCLCGNVQYDIDMPEDKALEGTGCHCSSCMKSSSGPSFQITCPPEKVKLTKGKPKTYTDTGKSGKPVYRRFCGDCGSPVWTDAEAMPEISFVKVGALNIANKVKLSTEIFCEEAEPSTLNSGSKHLDSSTKPFKG